MRTIKKSELKTYLIDWTATIYGTQTVQAFDELDARDQFQSRVYYGEGNEIEVQAELEEVRLEQKRPKR